MLIRNLGSYVASAPRGRVQGWVAACMTVCMALVAPGCGRIGFEPAAGDGSVDAGDTGLRDAGDSAASDAGDGASPDAGDAGDSATLDACIDDGGSCATHTATHQGWVHVTAVGARTPRTTVSALPARPSPRARRRAPHPRSRPRPARRPGRADRRGGGATRRAREARRPLAEPLGRDRRRAGYRAVVGQAGGAGVVGTAPDRRVGGSKADADDVRAPSLARGAPPQGAPYDPNRAAERDPRRRCTLCHAWQSGRGRRQLRLRKVRARQDTVVGNAHPGLVVPRDSATESKPPMGRACPITGKGERVR